MKCQAKIKLIRSPFGDSEDRSAFWVIKLQKNFYSYTAYKLTITKTLTLPSCADTQQ
jgi:hypothetical protein